MAKKKPKTSVRKPRRRMQHNVLLLANAISGLDGGTPWAADPEKKFREEVRRIALIFGSEKDAIENHVKYGNPSLAVFTFANLSRALGQLDAMHMIAPSLNLGQFAMDEIEYEYYAARKAWFDLATEIFRK